MNSFIREHGEEQARVLLQRELEVNHERHPGFLPFFHQKMWNGQIHGFPMRPVYWGGTFVACFYGWLNDFLKKKDSWEEENEEENQVAIILGYGTGRTTDIEKLIIGVTGEGATPATSEPLHLLNELIAPFLEQPGEEEKESL